MSAVEIYKTNYSKASECHLTGCLSKMSEIKKKLSGAAATEKKEV